MAKKKGSSGRKPLVWLQGKVETPPFTRKGRQEAGMLLRLLQEGEQLEMPQAEPLPDVGPGCGALRVREGGAQLANHVSDRLRMRAHSRGVFKKVAEDSNRGLSTVQTKNQAIRNR